MKVLNLDLANKTATLEAFGETRTVTLDWFREDSPTNNPNRKPFFQAHFKGMGYRVGYSGKKIHSGSTGIFKIEEDCTPRQIQNIRQAMGNRELQVGDYYISGTKAASSTTASTCWPAGTIPSQLKSAHAANNPRNWGLRAPIRKLHEHASHQLP